MPISTIPARRLRVVVVQGHRNTGGGDPREQARTPAIANAITAALQRAGHEAICLQNADGTVDDWFHGSLDAVACRVVDHHNERPVDLMLDVHIEGDPARTPGVFAIIPDGDGLQTLTGYAGSDSAVSNSLDRTVARAIAHAVGRQTGLRVRDRGTIEPGVMSERQTHVGADLGWRLAMFGYTVVAREQMVRLVLECGNIESDRAIIDHPSFPANVAAGVVAGVAEGFGAVGGIVAGPVVVPVAAPFPPFGTIVKLAGPTKITVAADALNVRRWAETDQPIMTVWRKGHVFWADRWIAGERVAGNPCWWITGSGRATDRQWRVWSGGTDRHELIAPLADSVTAATQSPS
ncbi:MAG TPA: N-acetylmuramoyl-L-alanine amidase [Thermomicrobiales bacterium]|nr:N-acetylmuramoyl-L-alanine amidase [Thermomicrobiales bacterium]